jgi:hypothetical protein
MDPVRQWTDRRSDRQTNGPSHNQPILEKRMAVTMTSKERLTRAIRGQEVDCIPSIGGWSHSVTNLRTIAGLSVQQYLADPLRGVLLANKALEVDGIVANPIVPDQLDQIRSGQGIQYAVGVVVPLAAQGYAASLVCGADLKAILTLSTKTAVFL